MKRILVVEDDSVLRENIIVILEEEYLIVGADDGSKAISILEKDKKFDLILSDIMMPNVDGYELYDYIKKSEVLSEIPFIFLSARANNAAVRKGMNLGVEDYITKPFSIDDLIEGIRTRLSKKETIDEKVEIIKNNIALYVPHELRTPLVSILGNSDLISSYFDEFSKKDIIEMSDSINKSGKRLMRSIEKFLKYTEFTIQKNNDFTDIEAVDTFYSSKHNCKSVLESCYDCLERIEDIIFDFKNAELKILQEDFETMMLEIVANACKFSTKGSPITVSGDILNNKYVVEVIDKGIGISKENIDRIGSFTQFNREYYQQDGNGIGLALVQLICEKYDVNLLIESKIDEFTKVTLEFKILTN